MSIDKDLQAFYKSYQDGVEKQLKEWLDKYGDLSFSKKIEFERLININNEIRQILGQPSIDIANTIKSHVLTEGSNAYNGVYHSLETGYNINLNFNFLDEKYLEKLMNAPVAGSTLSKRLYKYCDKLASDTSNAIARGMMFGYGYDRIALEIQTITEANYRQALRIARTEGGRVRSTTTQKGYEEAKKKGVDLKKQWMATLDVKTRQDHSQLDGQVRDIDEPFEVNGYEGQGPRMFGVAEEDINCRCTTVTVVNGIAPKLYQEGDNFYQKKYDDWLKEQGKKNVQDIMKNPIMKEIFGSKNYNNFLNSLNSIENRPMKDLIEIFGNQLEFKEGKESTVGNIVYLMNKSFNSSQNKMAMQSVFHEISHGIDNLGVRSLGSDFSRVSEIPKYGLKKAISKDLLNLFNNDLRLINGNDYQKLKNLKKMSIFDQGAIVRKYKKLAEENPFMYSALSDMMESTGAFIDRPLGNGHGLKYWKTSGNQEAEFFAHMAETLVNKDARKMMYELFPTAVKKWEKMLNDILKSIK